MCERSHGSIGSGAILAARSHLRVVPNKSDRNIKDGTFKGGKEGNDRYEEELIDQYEEKLIDQSMIDEALDDLFDWLVHETCLDSLMDDVPSGDDGAIEAS